MTKYEDMDPDYIEKNVRVLTMKPLLKADSNNLETLELFHELHGIYQKVQDRLLTALGHSREGE